MIIRWRTVLRWLIRALDRLLDRLLGRSRRPKRPGPRAKTRADAGRPAPAEPRRRDPHRAPADDASRMDPYLKGLRTLHESGLDPDLAIDAAETMGRNYRRRYAEPDTETE